MDNFYEQSTFSIWQSRILKVAGVAVALVAFITGISACILSSVTCVLAGILQILVSIMILIFEAPFLFRFVSFTTPIADFAEDRSFIQKGIVFCVSAIIPIIMCATVSTGIGSGLVLLLGIVYIVLSVKGSRNAENDLNDTTPNDIDPNIPYNQ